MCVPNAFETLAGVQVQLRVPGALRLNILKTAAMGTYTHAVLCSVLKK